MAHRVVLWTPVARAEIEARIATVPGADVVTVADISGLAAALPDSEVLVTMGQLYGAETAKLLRRDGKRLRWIQLLTAGYDGLMFHGVPPGVVVTNAGGCYSPMVAEHAMMLLLALVRRLPLMLANQARHAFDRSFLPRLGALDGATMAIVGFGSIGREVARRARPFGMRVIGLTRSARPDPLADEIHPMTALHEMLGRADAVVLAMPLSAGEQEDRAQPVQSEHGSLTRIEQAHPSTARPGLRFPLNRSSRRPRWDAVIGASAAGV